LCGVPLLRLPSRWRSSATALGERAGDVPGVRPAKHRMVQPRRNGPSLGVEGLALDSSAEVLALGGTSVGLRVGMAGLQFYFETMFLIASQSRLRFPRRLHA
jgi:hypothetical protein